MDLKVTAKYAEINGNDYKSVVVTLDTVEKSDILDQFTIEDILAHFDNEEILDEIGKEKIVEYFETKEESENN